MDPITATFIKITCFPHICSRLPAAPENDTTTLPRDKIMKELAISHPIYKWEKNKGYPTKEHRKAIIESGKCEHHRNSFQLTPRQTKLDI